MLNLASFELRMNWPRTCECLISDFISMDRSLIFAGILQTSGGCSLCILCFRLGLLK